VKGPTVPDEKKFKTPFAEYDQVQQQLRASDPAELARTAADLARAQAEEYGQYVAAEPIFRGPALAFDIGHRVPASSVSDEGPVYPHQVAPLPREDREAEVASVEPPAMVEVQPAGNASAEEWRAYAVGHGVSDEEAAGLGRDELRARFQPA
jgi:hypothetical protein